MRCFVYFPHYTYSRTACACCTRYPRGAPTHTKKSYTGKRARAGQSHHETSRSSLRSTALFPAARHSAAYCTVRAACVRKGWLEVAGRSGSAGMLVLVTARSSAATFPVARVDSVSPVARRAGMLRSLTDGAGAGEWGGPGRKRSVGLASRSQWTGRHGRFGSRRSAARSYFSYNSG